MNFNTILMKHFAARYFFKSKFKERSANEKKPALAAFLCGFHSEREKEKSHFAILQNGFLLIK